MKLLVQPIWLLSDRAESHIQDLSSPELPILSLDGGKANILGGQRLLSYTS